MNILNWTVDIIYLTYNIVDKFGNEMKICFTCQRAKTFKFATRKYMPNLLNPLIRINNGVREKYEIYINTEYL